MNKMILGTVQLGLPYGINNRTGQPSREASFEILDYAFHNGVKELDTASAYGVSEDIIGEYIKNTGNVFEICTKFIADSSDSDDIEEHIKRSMEKLNVSRLYVYYLHRFEQCKVSAVIKQLQFLKMKNKISNIGISIYEPQELVYIIEHLSNVVDIVQIPFNLFDNSRWKQENLLLKAKEKQIKIFARSIFLQGLLLASETDLNIGKQKVNKALNQIEGLAKKKGTSIAGIALGFVDSQPEIERYLVGCETIEQLKENIKLRQKRIRFLPEELQEIKELSMSMDVGVIDPRLWKAK